MALRQFEIDAIVSEVARKIEAKGKTASAKDYKEAVKSFRVLIKEFTSSDDYNILKLHKHNINLDNVAIFFNVHKLYASAGGFKFCLLRYYGNDFDIKLEGHKYKAVEHDAWTLDKSEIRRRVVLSQLKDMDVNELVATLVEDFS